MFLHFFTNKENQKVIYLIKTIVNKKTDKWYIEWQRVTTNDNEWQRVTTNENEWYDEWQRVVQRVTTSDNEWQRVTTNDNELKWHNILQRMDDCHSLYNKNRYTTLRDEWLILEWLNK